MAEDVRQLIDRRALGPSGESLLRHAIAMTAAEDTDDLLAVALRAASDVSGLGTALLLLPGRRGTRVRGAGGLPTALEIRVRAAIATDGSGLLETLAADPSRVGARAALTVPVGPFTLLLLDREDVPAPPVHLLELLATQAWTCLQRLDTIERLREAASSDPLTGLRHSGPFGERLAAATPGHTALLAVDIDQFKSINDRYGHQAGDAVLVELAGALKAALRHGDELYRVGGDEFVAVLEVQHPEEAAGIGERLVEAARRSGHTVSVGVAICQADEPPESTLRRADSALYQAKRSGRDGVSVT